MTTLAEALGKVVPNALKRPLRLCLKLVVLDPAFRFLRFFLLIGIWRPSCLPVQGKEVLVVGSGNIPHTWVPTIKPSYVVAVNGSLANAAITLGLKCDALVCDASLFNEVERRTNPTRKIAIEKGWPSRANVGNLITVQSNNLGVDLPPENSLTYGDYSHVNRIMRRVITSFVSESSVVDGWDHVGLTSTGAFAVALALACGANKVELVGFSLRNQTGLPTHYYGTAHDYGTEIRNHSAADAHLIAGATLAGYTIEAAESDFAVLTSLSSWVRAGK